ncbi:hypothetical protein WR25_26036 [Diploscapter pachys]|uniref:Uncharacterized protein n=1 Tax=Diploscapter pachys TaxID=2018661 RepID=A0A2A2M4V5_9BILA|nr:hypothetical protein WR25_26036 [Diploscapter pachys]
MGEGFIQPAVGVGCEHLAHCFVGDPVERVRNERPRQQRLRARRGDAAALHVEERACIEFADRRAVRALHVVGEDFELGLQVHRRGALQQQTAQRLFAVGLLRIARHLDRGGEADGRTIGSDRAPQLVRLPVGVGVADADRAFLALLVTGQQRAAEFGIGAVAVQRQRGVEAGAGSGGAQCDADEAGGFGDGHLVPSRDEARILHDPHRAHDAGALAQIEPGQRVGPTGAA